MGNTEYDGQDMMMSLDSPPAIPDRPVLDGEIKVRLSRQTRANLDYFARIEHRTTSQLVRNILRGWCRSQRRKRGWDAA